MRGRFRSWLWFLFPLAILVLFLVIFWNWDWFIPFIDSRASAAIGRKVSIEHVGVRLGRTTIVTARGITIGNPQNFPPDEPPLMRIDQLRVSVAVMAYIRHHTLSLTRIVIDHPEISARELPDRRNNYTLHMAQQNPRAHPPKIGELIINHGTASVVMPSYKANFDIAVQTRPAPAGNKLFTGGEIVADAHGSYAGAPVTGHFIGGALLTLRNPSIPYPIDLQVRNGTTRAHLVGTINDPEHLSGAHLQLSLSGQNMANLYQLSGIPAPVTPPFSLTGHVDYSRSAIRFKNFYGRLGSSDLEGTISEVFTAPRPTITGDVSSHHVDLTDFAGVLGGVPGKTTTPGQTAATRAKVAEANARPNVLPRSKFNVPEIKSMDVDLRYRGAHIINRNIPLDNFVTHVVIKQGRITVDPLNFAVGTGTIAGHVTLDPAAGGLRTKANIDFQRLPLSRLMAATHTFAGNGTVGGSAHLTGTGDSTAQLFGHGDGHATLFLENGGSVSALLVDLVGLQMGDAVLSALGIPVKTNIHCLVADFVLTNGLLDTKTFLIATKAANILGSGTVNLANEQLALQLRTQATHVSIGSLSTPINIGGSLKHPSVEPAPGPLAARAGPAAALGILFPPLAVLPTIRLGLGDKNACVDTINSLHPGEPHNPR
jgi:AsmA family protein